MAAPCSYRDFDACSCTDKCQSETAALTITLSSLQAKIRAEEKRKVSTLTRAAWSTTGIAFVALIIGFSLAIADEKFRQDDITNQKIIARLEVAR